MRNILLCSPDFIRLNSNISDNVNSKVLATAIREVQEDELQEILGQLLFEKQAEPVPSRQKLLLILQKRHILQQQKSYPNR